MLPIISPGLLPRLRPSGEVLQVATWDERPTSEVDGRWLELQDTGGIYRWSAVAQCWVHPYVQAHVHTLEAYLTGTVDPTADGWTVTASGGGAVASDGTRVDCDGLGVGELANVAAAYPVTATRAGVWASGLMTLDSNTLNPLGACVALPGPVGFTLDSGAGRASWCNAATGVAGGIQNAAPLMTTERWVDLVVLDGSDLCLAYFDHNPVPGTVATLASVGLSVGLGSVVVGDIEAAARGRMLGREIRAGWLLSA